MSSPEVNKATKELLEWARRFWHQAGANDARLACLLADLQQELAKHG